jgi:hypothetical protein
MEDEFNKEASMIAEELHPYARKWVALVHDKVVASGETLREVEEKAEQKGYPQYATFLVPPTNAIFIPLAA